MAITFNNGPITLKGKTLAVGDTLGSFTLTDNGLGAVTNADLGGLKVFVVVPSLDTPVCDLEVRTFNAKAAELPGVKIYAVSKDLPFAQARWCGAAGVESVQALSDYKDGSFGEATGTYIEELGLLTRAVFVVDGENKVRYVEYVPEVTNQPDFDAVYAALQKLA